jgi:hypothetical protein
MHTEYVESQWGFNTDLLCRLGRDLATTTRKPWAPPKRVQLPPRKYRFSKDDRLRAIDYVASVLRNGEPTKFARSAALVHRMRQQLCLRGWPWIIAHETATDIVQRALDRLGVKPPPWIDGQPEVTELRAELCINQPCWNCGDRLPMFKKRYCCRDCREAVQRFLQALHKNDKGHGVPPWRNLAEATAAVA